MIRIILSISAIVLLSTILIAKSGTKKESVSERTARIHESVLTVDTHTDTPLNLLRDSFNLAERHDPHTSGTKVDLPRMKEGGLDAQFFAVFISQGPRTDEGHEKAKNSALNILDGIYKSVDASPELAEIAKTPEDAYRLEKAGKRAIYIGVENGYPIGHDLTMVKRFYDLGARYITLCHSSNNDICDSSTDKKGPEYNGLSPFGVEVVKEMNRTGMMVDVSHISDSSFYDVIRLSKAPVIASHSCVRAICNNKRNLSDDQLKTLAKNGGVIQMCILSDYVKTPGPNPARDSAMSVLRNKYNDFQGLSEEQEKVAWKEWRQVSKQYPNTLATVKDAVDHIDHIVKLIGIDHVGIGTDFDGGGGLADCFDVSQMGNITLELVRRGYSDDDIRKIWGGNFMRVFRAVEKVAGKI
jgi:membrane dipeptidase